MKYLRLLLLALCCSYAFSTTIAEAGIAYYGELTTPAYWLQRTPNAEKTLLSEDQIANINKTILNKDLNVQRLSQLPEQHSALEVQSLIIESSQGWLDENAAMPLEKYYYNNGVMNEAEWNAIVANCNINAIPQTVNIQYAVTTKRADLRLLPTTEGIFNSNEQLQTHYDNMQGTAVDPAEAVAIIHKSADGKFSLVMTRNYSGWINNDSLAMTDRANWLIYAEPKEYAVATDNKTSVEGEGINQLYQMGARIPMEYNNILLPTKNTKGQLEIMPIAFTNTSNTMHKGNLPFSKANIIRQSFKFLGDEYGWGGQDNSVDCSSFVANVYRSMGIDLPRDVSMQQKAFSYITQLDGMSHDSRLKTIANMQTGTVLFNPSHVMLYIGNDAEGKPVVIQSVSSYYEADNKIYLRQVIISGLNYTSQKGIAQADTLTLIGNMCK